jgi:gluconate 2-dehydrogenase gamma chain
MKRRDLFKTAAAGAATLTAHAQHTGHNAPAAPSAKAPAWKPQLFDDHQNATVIALSDLIIPATDTPGAKAARVNEYVDLILAEGGAERRARFIEGLGMLDGVALREHSRPFVRCTPEQQTAILARLSKSGDAFFLLAKRLTIEGYYSSRQGIAELNKGGRVPKTFGCTGADH